MDGIYFCEVQRTGRKALFHWAFCIADLTLAIDKYTTDFTFVK
jgi:hypothetical protein